MHQALKKVGPSYLCGATHQYRDAIEGLRMSMLEAGVPDTLAKLSVNALDAYIKKEHGEKRATITADECKNIYKMP